jgi:dihydrolipoamide dehydrogenase-binding protein of pyruvate dehydrogenase complex
MFGVSEFTAVINPPQACIMAVGTSRVELDHDATPQTYMKVTLSADARIVDEFLATRFLEAFKEVMENPMLMLSQAPKVDLQQLFAK